MPKGRAARFAFSALYLRGSGRTITLFAMKKYRCTVCEYIYDPEVGDPENGIAPGTPFEELPDGWICPVCGEPKEVFDPID